MANHPPHFLGVDLEKRSGLVARDRRPISQDAADRIAEAANEVLGAIYGMAGSADALGLVAKRILTDPAHRLHDALEAIGRAGGPRL